MVREEDRGVLAQFKQEFAHWDAEDDVEVDKVETGQGKLSLFVTKFSSL